MAMVEASVMAMAWVSAIQLVPVHTSLEWKMRHLVHFVQ
jgi:hypothetical protein